MPSNPTKPSPEIQNCREENLPEGKEIAPYLKGCMGQKSFWKWATFSQ
jgi:hypothetical protein